MALQCLAGQTDGPDKRRGPSLWPRAIKNGPKCEENCSFQHSFFINLFATVLVTDERSDGMQRLLLTLYLPSCVFR